MTGCFNWGKIKISFLMYFWILWNTKKVNDVKDAKLPYTGNPLPISQAKLKIKQ